MKYFYSNIAGHEDWETSFLGLLIESGHWDKDSFWKFHAEVTKFIIQNKKCNVLPRKISADFSRIIFLIMIMYSAHHNPNDVYSIKGVHPEELDNLIERVEWLSSSFFSGKVPKEDFFENNPYLLEPNNI